VGKLSAAVGALALVGLAAGCSSTTTVVNHPSGSSSPAHVGDALGLKTASGHAFDVTLTQVVDKAHSTGSTSAGKNKRFVAVLFKVNGASDQAIAGDANADANLVGPDGTTYFPSHDSLSECASHSSRYQVAAGASTTSCVAFILRKSVKIAKVQFYPAAGSASVYGEWLVP